MSGPAARSRQRWPLLALLLLFGLYRVGLLGRGTQSIGDELLYYHAPVALELLLRGEGGAALAQLDHSLGRPGQMLLALPPAAVQLLLHGALGLPVACPDSLLVPALQNVLLSLLGAWALHCVARRLLLAEGPALCVTAIYGLLASANMYVRHILPYDAALSLGLCALALALREARGPRPDLTTGLVLGSAYACYPGYWALPPVVLAAVAARPASGVAGRARALVWVGLGGLLVALACELAAAAAGRSYLGSLRALSGTIRLGSFEEAWRFLPRHLLATQGPWGAALLLLGLACPLGLALRRGRRAPVTLLALLAAAGLCYLLHGALSAWEKMVFYGRVVRLYHPFLVLAAVGTACVLPRPLRRAAQVVLLLCALAGFLRFALPYQRLAYPRDVLYREGVWTLRQPPERMLYEFPPFRPIQSPPGWSRGGQRYREEPRLVLVNFAYFAPVLAAEHQAFHPPPGARLRFDGPHFLAFPAYGFEGHAPAERQALWSFAPRIQIWELAGP